MRSILLIDDDPYEIKFVERALHLSAPNQVVVTHVQNFEDAMIRLERRRFDLVLLDDRLTRTLSAQRTVPAINTVRADMPLAVMSADITSSHLACPKALDVDFIVDKIDLVTFLRAQLSGGSRGTTCDGCEFQGRLACSDLRTGQRQATVHAFPVIAQRAL